jgi:hypothetical protein
MSFGTIDGMSDEGNKSLKGWYWYDWANQEDIDAGFVSEEE